MGLLAMIAYNAHISPQQQQQQQGRYLPICSLLYHPNEPHIFHIHGPNPPATRAIFAVISHRGHMDVLSELGYLISGNHVNEPGRFQGNFLFS